MEATRVIEVESNISLGAALTAVQATVKHAGFLGIQVNVAVVDRSGILVAFMRMTGSPLHSIEIAKDKAYTAVSYGRDTEAWNTILESRSLALRHGLMNRPHFAGFGGGIVIVHEGTRLGAIGVSGGSESQDIECARAGLSAIGLRQ